MNSCSSEAKDCQITVLKDGSTQAKEWQITVLHCSYSTQMGLSVVMPHSAHTDQKEIQSGGLVGTARRETIPI